MLDFGSGEKVVLVLSGGIDSSVLLYAALDAGKQVTVFHGHYAKPSSQKELAFAKWAANEHRLPIEVVDLSGITAMQVGYVDPIQIASDEADMKAEELNADNAVSGFHTLISAAAYFTQITSNNSLAIGLIQEQATRLPQLGEALVTFENFIAALNPAAPRISLVSPLLGFTKSEVIRLGVSLNVPFAKTWSCSSAVQLTKHCGVCAQCEERKGAFIASSVEDPTDYVND